ncbi:hypothetical protein KC19_10G147600 [Ceratodon purpureus]|uniref:Ubiquitin-like protease family profile domain-containing protein n=1 Tax=Ceratodon purpureus TaxID=3225 RepID=A0A8T0GQP4_CERPU|nr:hypothetical protein KC19_10G147600 [Ceratodon purpureus]
MLEEFSEDDSDGLEVEGNQDSVAEKFREFSDEHLDDEIEKYKGYATGTKTGLRLPDEGAKFTMYLHNLEKEKEARRIKRSLAVSTPKPQDIDFHCRESGTSEDLQSKSGIWLTSLSKDFATCSTVKTESLLTKIPLHSPNVPPPHEDFKSASPNNGNFTVSSDVSSQSPSPARGASPVKRTTPVPPGKQAGSSRRKAKTPDPSFDLDSDLKTPAPKVVRRITRKRARETDIVGRTPDTAMEINSSDEDEKAQSGIGSVLRRSSIEVHRRMGLRNTNRRRTDPDAVEILPSDLQRLDPMEFLNDTVIDFYIKYIQTNIFIGSEGRQRFHFFNSFFYKKLSEVVSTQKKKGGADFSKLRKWTKGTNVFEKDYLIVPIHDKLHWSLAIICFPGSEKGGISERCIIHLDSMTHGHDSQRVFRLLRSYLVAEWKHSVQAGENQADECIQTVQCLKADSIPTKKVPVPLQDNESDCGLFLLHYIRKFVENAPKAMKLSDLEGNWDVLGVFGRKWFHSTEASSLRTSIQEQLYRLFDQEILDHAQVNDQSISSGGTSGVCEVVIPLDEEAARK